MDNLLTNDEAVARVADLKAQGKKVVFTNGCFDIIHAGHIRYLTAARKFGDFLVVGLNSDNSVRRLKGRLRPINGETDRAEVLLGLKPVDAVTIFEDDTASRLVEILKPDIYAKGADYTLDTLPEARLVGSYGGRVALIDLLPGRSTTAIINRAKG